MLKYYSLKNGGSDMRFCKVLSSATMLIVKKSWGAVADKKAPKKSPEHRIFRSFSKKNSNKSSTCYTSKTVQYYPAISKIDSHALQYLIKYSIVNER